MRKNLLLWFCLCWSVWSGAAAELQVAVTVAPVQFLAEQIAGDKLKIVVAIPEGRSIHDYQPSPAQLTKLIGCDAYLTTGLWFEERVLAPFLKESKVRVIPLGTTIERLPLGAEELHAHGSAANEQVERFDPHIWLSIANAEILLKDLCEVFCELSPADEVYFKANLTAALQETKNIQRDLRQEFKPYQGRTFLVYHPAFAYFAKEFDLAQLAIEQNGKTPTPRQLERLIRQARQDKIHTIFVQPQYNRSAAQTLQRTLNAEITVIDPLAFNLFAQWRQIGEELLKGFQKP